MKRAAMFLLVVFVITFLAATVAPAAPAGKSSVEALTGTGRVRGKITRIGSNFVTIRRNNRLSKVRVYVDQSTIIRFEGEESELEDLDEHERITARFRIVNHRRRGTRITAEGEHEVEGTITSLNTGAGTLRVRDQENGEVFGLITDANTIFEKDDAHVTLGDFAIGEHVETHFNTVDGDDVATKIEGDSEDDD